MTNPLALIGVNDVVADFTAHTIRSVDTTLDVNVVTPDVLKAIPSDRHADVVACWASPGWWMELPLVEKAQRGIELIRQAGYGIRWLDDNERGVCSDWEGARRTWLRREFDAHKDDIIFGYEKRLVRGDLFIDSRPEHVFGWEALNGSHAYLFSTSWNEEYDWPSVRNWNDIDLVLERIQMSRRGLHRY
jgi:5'(3')-deoxyribonucleotidase